MPLKLPPSKFFGCPGFLMPGEKTVAAMNATFEVQRGEMEQHSNKNGELSKGDTGTGDTPCFENHFNEDADEAAIFAYSELIANVFDVPVTAGLADHAEIRFVVDAGHGSITLTRGDGEGLAGFAPTQSGIVLWNLSTPFSPAALVRGGKTRPKLLTKKGTGGFNYGLKQAIKNLLGDDVQVAFSFVGYAKEAAAAGAAGGPARPPAGLKAMTTYRWVPLRKNPNTIKFKEDPLKTIDAECNVPTLVQEVTWQTWQPGPKKRSAAWAAEFTSRQHDRFAIALSSFERVYKCDRSIHPSVRGMPYYESGVEIGSPEILHRDCFSLRLATFGAHALEMPEGPLLLVGERFYRIADGAGLDNLVLRIPGKGMQGIYKAFYSEARRVTVSRYVDLLATVIVGVINAAETKGCPRTLAIRKELATQLMPLLVNSESPIFGKANGPLIASLMDNHLVRNNINPLRNLLIRELLRGSPAAEGLSEAEFEARIAKNPIVHSGGDVPRASVLAHIIGTFQVPVNSADVHPLLYRSTNLPKAEERAARAVHASGDRGPPPALPACLQAVAHFVLGKCTKVAYLPRPADKKLADAAVPFRHDDDAAGTHIAVMWVHPDPVQIVKQVCELRVTGVKAQTGRADAVRQALNSPECLNLGLAATCEAILAIVRASGSGYSSDPETGDAPNLKDWAKRSLLGKGKRARGDGDSSSDSSSDDETPLSKHALCLAVDPKTVKKAKRTTKTAKTESTTAPAPFVARPGEDGLQAGGGAKGVHTVVSRPGGTCYHREPLPGEPCVLTHLNQKPITMGGEVVYVPSESAPDGAELPAPEGFFDRLNAYKQAKFAIVRLIGITTRVMPSWCVDANWLGITFHGENLVLVNLPLLKTQGRFEETILHETAHALCGANCGHSQPWHSKLGQLNAALTDAKYAEEK
jgi:hypothetical protein